MRKTVHLKLNQKASNVYAALFASELTRFVVLVAGRRFGKTYLATYSLLTAAANDRRAKCWYVAPTYKQAKEIAWDIVKEIIPREWIHKINEAELTVTLKNYAKISLKGADNPDSLRGPGLSFVVFDEYANIKKDAWEAVIRPTLTTTCGKALFIGTPQGYNHLYDAYMRGIATGDPDSRLWRGFQYTSMQGGYIPYEELELARRETDPRIFRQEYEASFETLTGRVYYKFDRNLSVWEGAKDNGGDVLIGIDFNVDPMSAVIGNRAGDQLHIFDEIEIPNSNTEELAQIIKERYGRLPVDDPNYALLKEIGQSSAIPFRLVRTFPDPSGRARKTAASIGVTDYTILQNTGFEVIAPRAAPRVIDRLNTVNTLLCNAAGERKLLIHPRCKRLIRCLDGLTYKEGTNAPNKELNLDHLPDALGYLVWSEFPVLRSKTQMGELYIT